MKYMVIVKNEQSTLALMDEEDLESTKGAIEGAIGRGVLVGAYAFVGGGSLLIVDTESNGSLAYALRKLGIFNAEVTPLIDTLSLIAGYQEHRRSLENED